MTMIYSEKYSLQLRILQFCVIWKFIVSSKMATIFHLMTEWLLFISFRVKLNILKIIYKALLVLDGFQRRQSCRPDCGIKSRDYANDRCQYQCG